MSMAVGLTAFGKNIVTQEKTDLSSFTFQKDLLIDLRHSKKDPRRLKVNKNVHNLRAVV
jgi:hypothetical protein